MSFGSFLRNSTVVVDGEAAVSNIFQLKEKKSLTTFAKLSVCFERESLYLEDYDRVDGVESKKILISFDSPIHKYLTGSRYMGEMNKLGFVGKGVYRYPHGVYYKGHFNNRGEFHGVGELVYPMGQKLEGVWKHGVLQHGYTFTYSSGQVMDENMKYCYSSDRRYDIEIKTDFAPVGSEYITPEGKSAPIPEGCYDIIEGIYSMDSRFTLFKIKNDQNKVFERHSFSEANILEMEDGADEEFRKLTNYSPSTKFEIEKNTYIKDIPIKPLTDVITHYCETNDLRQPVGFVKSLYPVWMAGRRQEVYENVNCKFASDDFSTLVMENTFTTPKKMYSFIQRPGKTI